MIWIIQKLGDRIMMPSCHIIMVPYLPNVAKLYCSKDHWKIERFKRRIFLLAPNRTLPLCISLNKEYAYLHLSDFLYISLHFSAFLCISLHFSAFLYISLHFSTFICISHAILCISLHCVGFKYDTVSDVVESGVQWRSNFHIGSRVLNCNKPILMHIYSIQCDFLNRSRGLW